MGRRRLLLPRDGAPPLAQRLPRDWVKGPTVDLALLGRVLALRRRLRTRERWTRTEVDRHRQAELGALRAHAYERSPFYRSFHAGRFDRPLAELPVLTKATLMGVH